MARTILFVCPHGAGKSRMAAAYFARVAPAGWDATTAGQRPDAEVSADAVRLMAGEEAEAFLDRSSPRPIGDVSPATRIVAIDCDVPGADRWSLENRVFDAALRDEIRVRAERLADALRDESTDALVASAES